MPEQTKPFDAGFDSVARAVVMACMPKPINLVVACSENRVIGRKGKLPWNIPEDTTYFHRLTAGQTIVLGRICYASWPQVRSDGRHPIVITRDKSIARSKVQVTDTVANALAIAQGLPGEIMICGGQRIYEETLPLADRIYLTLIHSEVTGDTYFPEWRHLAWRTLEQRESADANYRYSFLILERKR